MRRFLIIFVLAPLLIGFPTANIAALGSSSQVDKILYWTGSNADQRTECAANTERLSSCVDEVYLDDRKLEYRTKEELAVINDQTPTSLANFIQVVKSTSEFRCWAPNWPLIKSVVQPPANELCSYSQFYIYFTSGILDDESIEKPRLTVKVRKIKGDHPVTHLGFLHSRGPVHNFTPTSSNNEHASVTISPGLGYGEGEFTTDLQTSVEPEYAPQPARMNYGFFLVTGNVSGAFDMNDGFEVLPESRGAWQASNASKWGFFGDYSTSDYAIRVAGPHFQYKVNPADSNELNTSWFTAYMPRALVQRQFGIAPEQANESTLNVTRSVGKSPTQLPSTFSILGDGLLIETTGITFSKPVISIARRIQLRKNQRISVKNLIASAGIPRSSRQRARIVSTSCKSARRNCTVTNSSIHFKKPGRYVFIVSYSTRDARKRVIIRRNKTIIRVR